MPATLAPPAPPGRPGFRAVGPRTRRRAAPLVGNRPPVRSTGRGPGDRVRLRWGSEAHAAHATHVVATGHGRRVLLGLVGDDGLGREEERRDRGCVLQRRARHLDRVDDAGGEQVDVLTRRGVETVTGLETAHLLRDDATLETGVDRDLLERGLGRDAHDVGAGRLVTLEHELVERLGGLDESDATTGDDALLDGSLRVADGVLDAVLALLELDLRGRARLDDGDAAGELGEALLELLAVVVGVRLLDLGLDLGDAALDLRAVLGVLDDGRLVLGDDDLASAAEQVEGGVLELETDLLGDDLATGEDGDVGEHRLAAVAEAGSLDGDRLERALDLVHDERRERLTLDVLGDDQQRLARLHDLLEERDEVLDVADLGVRDEHVGVVEDGLHALGVGDEVGGDVALVEAHTLRHLQLEAHGVGVLDGDDTFLADLVHRLGDEAADLLVGRRDAGGRGDLLLGLDLLGLLEQTGGDGLDGLLDAALEGHRVGAGGHVAQAFLHHRLGEHGRRRRAVTGDVVGLLGNFLDELRTDLLVRVVELDLLGDRDAVVGDRGGAPLLLQDDVAALRAEGHADGVGEDVHSSLEPATRLFVKRNGLGHSGGPPRESLVVARMTPATDGTGLPSFM